ncbi:hypothetical protein [Streptosporangium roseum]|uniref:hypothetical protein n=1 Tax=Streptosporangium roseum TaxID=2001 RepID=UPI0033178C08
MALIYDAVHRLEADPFQHDGARGFAAEVADPAWFLGRQWQLGEHEGEDASSPVRLTYRARLTPINPVSGQPHLDPRVVPAEAIVESEPGDYWTPGRRVMAGRAVAAQGVALPDDTLLAELPVPYDVLDGHDGKALWERRAELGLEESWFDGIRPPGPEPVDLWDPAELTYGAEFTAGEVKLALERHDGGTLDWFSVDADRPLPSPATPAQEQVLFPGRIRHPAAPLPRWWQIEDTNADIGGYAPDRAHLATLLLIDLIANQSDDWFGFPIEAMAGHVVTLEEVVVRDSFGESWTLEPPQSWGMFDVHGLDSRSLVVWAVAATPLEGPVLDEVTIGVDEDANLLWAVEHRLGGRDLPTQVPAADDPPARFTPPGRDGFAYRPMTRVPPRWHPYVIEEVAGRRRFVQARAADLSGPDPVLAPEAQSDLLIDPASGGVHPTHQLEPAAIPAEGVRVERRAVLARASDGSPVLWTQRRRQPLRKPPGLRLRFDVLEQTR